MSNAMERWSNEDVALVDLIDRVIGGGVVITGDVVIGVAGVDLVYLGLRLVLAPAHEVEQSVSLGRHSA
jgi:Gas vesicle protein